MQKPKVFTGDILILCAMAIFGSYSLFLRLYPGIPTLTFLFSFQVVGAISFFIVAARSGFPQLVRRDWVLLAALTIIALANDLFYFAAFRMTSVANTAIAHQVVSIFLLFLAPLFLGERTRKDEWIALALSFIGIVVLYRKGLGIAVGHDFLGITFGVVSGFFYALLIILYRMIPDEKRGINIRIVNFWRYSMSTVLLLPFIQFMDVEMINIGNILPLVMFGLLFAVIASGIHNFGISKTRSLHVSILGKSEPAFAIIYAYIVLNEPMTVDALTGGFLIIGSSIWLAFRKGE